MYYPNDINVLIACEESQAECKAFRDLGFNAYSCDIKPVRKKGNPGWHIIQDVTSLLQGRTDFITQSGECVQLPQWDLIIAHPPCTYICKMGSVWMVRNGKIDFDRFCDMLDAVDFFYTCLNAKAKWVAVENPLPMRRANLPQTSCYLHPSWFGVKYTKKTLYWLKNLPPVMPELIYPNPKEYVHNSRGLYRSRTFPQVARAIAKQWGQYILDELNATSPA